MLKPLLTTALLFTAVPAIAGEKPAGLTVRVATADLDLATATGRRTLDRRIRAAVDEVCRPAEEAQRRLANGTAAYILRRGFRLPCAGE